MRSSMLWDLWKTLTVTFLLYSYLKLRFFAHVKFKKETCNIVSFIFFLALLKLLFKFPQSSIHWLQYRILKKIFLTKLNYISLSIISKTFKCCSVSEFVNSAFIYDLIWNDTIIVKYIIAYIFIDILGLMLVMFSWFIATRYAFQKNMF